MEFDRSSIGNILGRRIALKRRKQGYDKVVLSRLYLMFDDGTGFEIFSNGEIMPCQRLESFDLHSLTQRGGNAYNNEFLGITNPDGNGHSVLINKPLVLD